MATLVLHRDFHIDVKHYEGIVLQGKYPIGDGNVVWIFMKIVGADGSVGRPEAIAIDCTIFDGVDPRYASKEKDDATA